MNPIAISRQPWRRRWPWLSLLAGSGICCAAILLFPWLVLWEEAAAALSIRVLFSHICHQDPQRSLSLAGIVLPVCTRCLALYLGGFLGVLLVPLVRGHSDWLLGRRALLLGPLLLTGLDAGLDLAGLWTSTLWSRAATGGLAGSALGLYAVLFWKAVPLWGLNRTAGIWDNNLEGASAARARPGGSRRQAFHRGRQGRPILPGAAPVSNAG